MRHFATIEEAVAYVIAEKRKKNPLYVPERDSGLIGDAFEVAVKDYYGKPLTVSPAGRCDLRIGSRNYEVKQGGGELGAVRGKLLRGSGAVLFCPVVLLDQPLERQEAFSMDKAIFIEALDSVGAIRSKKTSDGLVKYTIQTYWVRKTNKPHGRLLERMIEAFYEAEGMKTLQELLEEEG